MASHFIDPTTPRYQLPFDRLPRGYIAWPQRVLDALEKEQTGKGFRFAQVYVQQSLERQTLSYYFDGLDVAYRPAEGGIEVLAVGWAEATAYRDAPGVKVIQA